MEQSDKDSLDVFDSEEYRYYAENMNDDDGCPEESLPDLEEMDSSSQDTDDIFGMDLDNFTSSPPHTRKIEHMEIKDVVKDKVLSYLPAKSLIRFGAVSKEWGDKIRSPLLQMEQSYCFKDISGFFCQQSETNPTFVTLNQAAYGVPTPSLRFLPDLVDIRTSSNGLLVCQGRNGNNSYYICNPASKAWKELPPPAIYHGSEPALVLAFEPSSLDMNAHYQLICAACLYDTVIVRFEIYTSETRSWRISSKTCVELGDSSFTGNGLYMNRKAYWKTSTGEVLSFDVKDEIYGIIPVQCESPLCGVLAGIHGELCYVSIANCVGNKYSINIYGGSVDLRLRQTVAVHLGDEVPNGIQGYSVRACFHGDAVMILVGNMIYSFNLSDQRLEVLSREAGLGSLAITRFLPYVNSLVGVA